jgi:hypothetical protein
MKASLALPLVRFCTALVLVVGVGGVAHARHHGKSSSHGENKKRALAEGRRHLKKANTYAGENKCWSAVPEYTAAYLKLGDPVVLFNRADCYRRVGENERAIADYREFLKALPKASNRADVELRIAALEKQAGIRHVDEADAKDQQPKKELPRGDEKSQQVATVQAPPPPASPPPPAPPPPVEQAVEPEFLAAKDPTPVPAPASPALLVPARGDALIVARAEKPKKRSYWWAWVLAGAAAAGGGVTAFLILRPHPATIPPTELGNYHF